MFIIISGLGAIYVAVYCPELKGLPLEEVAKIFGDTDDVMVYSEDIHIDHTTHDIVVNPHTGERRVVKKANRDSEKNGGALDAERV